MHLLKPKLNLRIMSQIMDVYLVFSKGHRKMFDSMIQKNDPGLVQKFINVGGNPGAYDNLLIRKFASNPKSSAVVEILLRQPWVNPSVNDNEPIRTAAKYGIFETVRLLLQHPAVDPSVNDNEPIRIAAKYGHTKVVDCLLKHKAVDPAALKNDALRMAIDEGHYDTVRCLLEDPRVDPAEKSGQFLFSALRLKHTNIVNLLQKHMPKELVYSIMHKKFTAVTIEHKCEGCRTTFVTTYHWQYCQHSRCNSQMTSTKVILDKTRFPQKVTFGECPLL